MRDRQHFEKSIKDNRFPASLFGVYLGVLLLMCGAHTGILIAMIQAEWNVVFLALVPVLYWAVVAVGLTLFTRYQIQRTYEEPMHKLADATRQVAGGDFAVYVPPLHTADKIDYVDIMIEDFNKMVEELGSIETLKTDFFSNVSHEIKTPIAIIQNNAEMLRREELTETQAEYAETILHTTRRLADLITNILKLNKLEKQAILPDVETYDLCAQLAECALNFEQIWEEKGIEFDAEMEDRVMITADPALMEIVWNNLFSNAVKFTEAGGSVCLSEESDEKEIRVSVRDSGCGMTEETKKHIFEKFYQGDTSHATAGNGLGLALVMRVLQLNGYGIEVKSAPGEGSEFTVVLQKR